VTGKFMLWVIYSWGKSPWYPLNRKLGEPHSWYGHGSEEKNPCPCCVLTPGPLAHN